MNSDLGFLCLAMGMLFALASSAKDEGFWGFILSSIGFTIVFILISGIAVQILRLGVGYAE